MITFSEKLGETRPPNDAISRLRTVCEHCNESLSTKTYKRHRKLYFNETTDEWITAESIQRFKKPKNCLGMVKHIPAV